ncbi:MAG TPA: zinc-ribbon domain-containing protein, partial [Gemmataceae bacterium]|nr:zinc-ribbon domain-containing protein [Gemmataceae bacterium]
MHHCPTCGKQLDDDVRFCPHDGTPIRDTAAGATVPTPHASGAGRPVLQLPAVVGGRYRLEEM